MLNKLVEVQGNYSQLKQWEKRSYKAYRIGDMKCEIIDLPKSEWKQTIRKHILDEEPSGFGVHKCTNVKDYLYNWQINKDLRGTNHTRR